MTTREDRLNASIDRANAKAQTSARKSDVREMAVATVNCFVMGLPEEDREPAMAAAARHLRTLYGAGQGERSAIALFGSLSKTDLDINRIARTLFRDAANENGGEHG